MGCLPQLSWWQLVRFKHNNNLSGLFDEGKEATTEDTEKQRFIKELS